MDTNSNFQHLIEIMAELREKCPWDRKQTIGSLRQMTLEETYELTDAITAEDWKGIKEELGDLLLHIAFYSKIAEEQAQFNINDVITTITEKLIRRHPHIYPPENGETLVLEDSEAVKKNWEKIKTTHEEVNVYNSKAGQYFTSSIRETNIVNSNLTSICQTRFCDIHKKKFTYTLI